MEDIGLEAFVAGCEFQRPSILWKVEKEACLGIGLHEKNLRSSVTKFNLNVIKNLLKKVKNIIVEVS